MNATEKAKILKENGYTYKSYSAARGRIHTWAIKGDEFVNGNTKAIATNMAYEHLEAERAQSADDAAGEAAYNEVQRSYSEVKAEAEHVPGMASPLTPDNAPKLPVSYKSLLQEIEKLKAELSEAQRRNVNQSAEIVQLQNIIVILEDLDLIGDAIDMLSTAKNYEDFATLSNFKEDVIKAWKGQPATPASESPIWQYGQEIRLYERGEDYELIVHHFGADDDMHMLSSLDEAFEILSLHHGYTNRVLHDFPKVGPAPTAQAASEVAPALAIEPIDEMGDGGFVWHEPKAPKTPVPTRCRVNWNKRGFSSGSYPVLGYSLEKQYYILDISTDCNRAMPKTVKMADCESAL